MTVLNKIRVLIVDDHTIFREGLRALLESEREIEVVGEASTGEEALDLSVTLKPDIAVMDISLGKGLNGFQATRLIREKKLPTKVIILSMFGEGEDIEQAVQSGVSGYLIKQGAARELLTAIREVQNGNAFFSPAVTKVLLERHRSLAQMDSNELTLREKEVLQMVAQGKTNKEIGERLNVSSKTVDKYRQHIMQKIGVHDAVGLTRYAISKGLVK